MYRTSDEVTRGLATAHQSRLCRAPRRRHCAEVIAVNAVIGGNAQMDVTATSAIRGRVLRPDDPGYDQARTVWNGMVDQRPAAIVQCLDVADVISAVNAAREAGLGVAVRGGGHNAAGLAVADGALVVDLTMMRRVDVDPAGKTARAEGGATWGDFDRATQAHGLATTGG